MTVDTLYGLPFTFWIWATTILAWIFVAALVGMSRTLDGRLNGEKACSSCQWWQESGTHCAACGRRSQTHL
jgi:hypothetical protein